ncbi:MAG TPA: hypothetical protein VNL14_20090 [Candidatus Acidoferrales bacterium]|nr:hypothetical protein [Candidatus Acidoferrales bacterium]
MMRHFATLVVFLALGFAPAYSQTPYYQGKTITVILGGPPGGSADMRTKAVTAVLPKHVPGNPTILMQYMQAGGGRQAANHIYNSARPDGLTLGSMGAALVANAVLGETGVQYDIDKLIYLGTPDSGAHYIFLTHREAGLSNLEKLRSASGIRIGAQSVGHPVYITGRLFAYILDLKDPKFVTGYSGPELDLALVRREIDARVNIGETLLTRASEWLEKGLVDLHAGIEIPKGEKHPRFQHLPDLETFAKSDLERKVLGMFRAFRLVGQAFFLPPGTPRETVQILRDAMRKTLNDPEFHKGYKKLTGDDPSPLTPEALEKAIKEIPRDREAVELFNKLAGGGALPPR